MNSLLADTDQDLLLNAMSFVRSYLLHKSEVARHHWVLLYPEFTPPGDAMY